MDKKVYKISDEVAMRMVQIFQEAVIFGVDGADLMRQVRLVQDASDPEVMTLDPSYISEVEEHHQKYVSEAEARQTASAIANLNSQTTVFS